MLLQLADNVLEVKAVVEAFVEPYQIVFHIAARIPAKRAPERRQGNAEEVGLRFDMTTVRLRDIDRIYVYSEPRQ